MTVFFLVREQESCKFSTGYADVKPVTNRMRLEGMPHDDLNKSRILFP
jgi:hypothetical protein